MTEDEYKELDRMVTGWSQQLSLPKTSTLLELRRWMDSKRPMRRGATPAETCILNNWRIGDIIKCVGTTSVRGSRVRINAIGKTQILGTLLNHGPSCGEGIESTWDLIDTWVLDNASHIN